MLLVALALLLLVVLVLLLFGDLALHDRRPTALLAERGVVRVSVLSYSSRS